MKMNKEKKAGKEDMDRLNDYIIKAVEKGRSIHIGAVGTNKRKMLKRHSMYKEAAKFLIGFDNDKESVETANSRGFDEIFLSDITNNEDVNNIIEKFGQFNTVIMTEVLEHIGNLTTALDNTRRLMKDDGRLYISTPHVRLWAMPKKMNPDHICWFCEITIKELLRRSKLKPIKIGASGYKLTVIAEKMGEIC